MTGRPGPPDGPLGEVPGSGDEEWRSTVFDESFVRSASLEEFSAQQRLDNHTSPVRHRAAAARTERTSRDPVRALPRTSLVFAAALMTVVLAVLLFGNPSPYGNGSAEPAPPPASSLLALQPEGPVPGGTLDQLYQTPGVVDLPVGPAGIRTPEPARTQSFTEREVTRALEIAERYVVASALSSEVVTGETALPVRILLRTEQQRQLDVSLTGRAGETPATAWLIRLDPSVTELADPEVRTDSRLTVHETGQRLEITVRQLAAYAVRPAGGPNGAASSLLAHRELVLAFTHDDIDNGVTVLVSAAVTTGPVDCSVSQERELHPVLAGDEAAVDGTGIDLFNAPAQESAPCGTLATPTA